MNTVPFYAALLGLLFLLLSVRAIKARGAAKVAIGDGGNPALQRAIAVHENFAQYVPLTLLLLAFAEMRAAPALLLHLLCLALLAGRAVHAYGVSQARENFRFRMAGMLLTLAALGVSALLVLGQSAYVIFAS